MRLSEQMEVAGSVAVNLEWARQPQYGRYLDEFVPGQGGCPPARLYL